jgi:hypothetical protein
MGNAKQIPINPYIFKIVFYACFKAKQCGLLYHIFCYAEINHYLICSSDQICPSTGNMLPLLSLGVPVIRCAFTVTVVNCWLGMTRLVAVMSVVEPQHCYECMYV